MTEEQGIELNRMLNNWVCGNPRLFRHTAYLRELVQFNAGVIVVELRRFNDSYLEKHVVGKVGNYANNFLSALAPVLRNFMLKFGIHKMEFQILFKFDFELKKYIEVTY